MSKNRIVLFIALGMAFSVILLALFFHFIHFENPLLLFLTLFLVFLFVFGTTTYILNRNIYKRIETLYKLVYASTINTENSEDIQLEKIEKQVKKWSKEKKPLIQQLKAQEKFRREFIGDVAHELKTPIFNIQGYIYTLIDGGLYDESINKKYLRKAQKNINRMIYMVQDLDLITKLETRELLIDKKHFSLHQAIEEAIEEVEMRAMEKDIQLKYTTPNKDFIAYGEKDHILRVLINLISNSVKYGKEGGQTDIRVQDNITSNKYLIQVKDNGIGIKEEDIPRIFERFYRVDKSRSRNIGGSGLGLSIVKHILEVHGESISVKSKLKEGTSFQFSLQKPPKKRTKN